MSKIIKLIVCLGIAGGASTYAAKDRANTFEEYGLSGPTLTMAKSCDRSMSRYNLEFKQGAKNHAGCACLAREVSTSIETPDYEFLSENFSKILEARHNKDDDAAAAVFMNAMTSGDAENAGNLMLMMGFMSVCSNRSTEQEIRQSYIAENTQTVENFTPAQTGLRSSTQEKPTGKCAALTDKQVAQREENARDAGLRFDRASCKMYSL